MLPFSTETAAFLTPPFNSCREMERNYRIPTTEESITFLCPQLIIRLPVLPKESTTVGVGAGAESVHQKRTRFYSSVELPDPRTFTSTVVLWGAAAPGLWGKATCSGRGCFPLGCCLTVPLV